MSLQQWHKNGWLRPHQTNRQQIADLLAIVERDLVDAQTSRLSCDWQFGIAYNAAGRTSPEEAKELINFAKELRDDVLKWLRRHHPDLL